MRSGTSIELLQGLETVSLDVALTKNPILTAEAEDMAMMRLLAREDIGLAVLPPVVVKNELQTGMLVEADAMQDLVEGFYAVTVDRKFATPLIDVLLGAYSGR